MTLRRHWIVGVLAGLLLGWSATGLSAAEPQPGAANKTLWTYIGTYTSAKSTSKGIYLAHFDQATGKLSAASVAAEVKNPSFLAIHPARPLLYAIGEIADFKGKRVGAVSALAIDTQSGKLTLLNQQSSQGAGPCHVAVDHSGRCVLVANYGGGSVACLPIEADGRLGEAKSFFQHQGSSVNPKRQAGPHAHGIYVDPANRFVFVPDLGLDKVMIYRLNSELATMTPNAPASASVPPGAGPRHLAFHPNGRFVYVINEMGSTLTVFRYDAGRGSLELVETVPTLPADFQGQSWTAEVVVHPSGKFVYGSNRGHDSIVAYAVDAETGKLRLLGFEPTQGKNPRNFNIDPSGRWLLAANQNGDNVVVLRIDPATGRLSATGHSIAVAMPVCVEFRQPGK